MADVRREIDAVWRIESPRFIASLARLVRDVGLAEDLAQDALVAALETWPRDGVPRNPGAWLMTAARNRAMDSFRSNERSRRLDDVLAAEAVRGENEAEDTEDEVLGLLFATCHPALAREAQVALTLRLLGGLETAEIARAFLSSEQTVAQRVVRAKKTLKELEVDFRVPAAGDLEERLLAVCQVLYLIFNEGYSASSGDRWTRPALCEDALRLGRMLAALMPRESEVHGLAALMELQASRLRARHGPHGEMVLLSDQNRGRWDRLLITRGLEALGRAQSLGDGLGFYTLQAAIAACHARAPSVQETDWERIAELYEALALLTGSPVVELNRAVALAEAHGPQAGLEHVDTIAGHPALAAYHLLPSVRGDLLARLDRHAEAREEFLRAAEQAPTEPERELLLRRARAAASR